MKRLLERIREILRNRHNRRAWARIISVIACLVVFFSTYALILPAITMEKTAYCGIEAHQHDDSCYSEELICTIPESEGHTHDDSCYTTHDELSCQLEEHVHGEGCYDEEGNLICELIEHEHDSSCWQEVTELTCGLEESEGHHHTDACYEKVLTCGKEAHTHSEECYKLNGPEAAGTAATDAQGVVIGGDNSGKPADDKTAEVDVSTVGETDPNAATDSAAVGLTTGAAADPDTYVPTLDELDFNRILNRNTGIYYYHVETAEDAAENQRDAENIGEENKNQGNDQAGEQAKSHPEEINSADIPADAWQKVNKKTVLGENDILRVYFSYTIPAGSLNETNDIARYRLPANLHISDDQIEAINKTENGIAAAFIDYDTLAITDADAYHKYLGVEAVEGTRRPGEIPAEDLQEYISAVVRVENIYDTEGLYGKKDALLGQDLVFTFVPYTVQTNQNTYDAQGDPTSAGETVKGWFTMDLTIDQIDFQPTSSADSSSDSLDPTSGTREAEIVFVEEYKDPAQGIDIDEISTKLVLKDMSGQDIQEQDDSAEDADNPENAENPEQAENVDDADNSEPVGEAADESDKEASAEGDADEANYPAQSFKDSITVRMGSLSTDTNAANAMNASNAENTSTAGEGATSAAAHDIQNRTELTVSVEAEEGTFPEGTTMHLAPVTGSDLDTVAEAVEGAVESRTAGFHAVDITFRDADGNEIEPRKPIKVSMQSESIRQAVENPSTAPVVVHVEDNKKENEKGNLAGNENVNGDGSEADREDEITAETDSSSSSSSNIGLDSATVTGTTVPGSAEEDNLTFEADSFSVYAVVYTVDFHREVNGKTYDFSIPGGGFVSLEHLAEVLGIARIGENTADSVENEAVEAENASENDVYNVGEETAVNENGAHVRTYEESISLNNVEVSEVTKKFVADVASVEFSSPELVWVGKVDEGTTVGRLKEANGLEVQYSAELTEEQIAEINSSTVESGDWALISVLPFMSEESLTVTMKNGDQWTVKVTDAQISTHVITADGDDFIITVTYGPEAGIPDGATLEAEEIPEGTEAYTKYLDEALAKLNGMTINDETEDEILQHTIEHARFFDISIMADGKKIEPNAPVSVEITYANMELARPLDMNVVHFADSGIEVISADTNISEEEEVHVSFEQESFSVTGTIVDYTSIGAGEYYIVHQEGQNWYALASDGNYVNVTDNYNASSSSISGYSGSKNISWEVSTSGTGYVIKSKGENKYITLNGSVVGSASTVLNLHAGSTSSRNARITIDDTYTKTDWGVVGYNTYDIPRVGPITVPVMGFVYYPASYYKKALGWDNRFTVNSSSPYDYWGYTNYYSADATNVQFAKLSNDSDILPGDYPNNTYNEAQLEKWLEQALNENPLKEVSKVGYVSDYDNRIYKIDFSAKSGVLAMASDISLAFVTDVSNSMLFPSSLTPVTTADFTNSYNTFSGEINLNSGNLDKLKHNNNQVYYAIGNKSGTSTVYALYYSDGWKAMDASYYARWKAKNQEPDSSHSAKSIGTSNTTLSSDSSGTKYTIFNANAGYAAGIASGNIYNMALGNMGNRLYYLEYSVDSAVKDLKTIAKEYPLGAVYVGLETFAGKNDNDSVKNRVPYTQIGGLTNTSGSSYDTNYQTIYNALKSIEGQDGTRQDVALSDSTFFGTYNANTNTFSGGYINSGNIAGTKKYVVLITDGAPNPADKKQNVIDMANRLKAAGINVITIGLSVEDVTIAPEMLWKSASSKTQANPPDSDRDRLFYWAKSGDDLTWILRDIVRSVMKEATVSATITDEIDDLFYPVDVDGKPLGNGDWIDINGKKVSQTDPSRAGKITFNSTKKTYTVTWQNQDASWDGWKGSIYVKAKEDFMGGNNVNTNVQASVVPESYTVGKGTSNSRTGTFSESAKQAKKVEPVTPYVNVDELHMTQNNSEWTVYLGTNVDPEEQLKALWNKIDVNTVVKTGGMNTDYTIKNENNMYYGAGGAEDKESPTSGVETIPLSHYISLDVLTHETTGLLKLLRDGNTESTVVSNPISYAPYGQGEVGTFIVSITKRVNDEAKSSAPAAHNTEKASEYDEVSSKYIPVETYSLSIQYVPKSEAERKTWLVEQNRVDENDENYQNHGGHGMAKEALESTSENTHKISVFAKKLTITKVDQTNTAIRNSGVVFKLYRKAQTGETPLGSANVPSGLPTGSYVLADTLTVDAEGKATTNIDISRLPGDEPYYLVETKAPDGYIALPGALEVRAAINDEVWTKVGTSTQPLTSSTKWNPYVLSNREHKATILVGGTGELSNYAVREGNIIYDQTLNGISYRIRNNAGVELPSTGGPGTTLLYLLGLLLTGLAGACLVMRTLAERADYGN